MDQILIRGPWLISGLTDWNLLLGRVFDQVLTTSESVIKL
jgi:hypothetical protein